jgi:formiminotetrahydrofolate cyclodeaminase
MLQLGNKTMREDKTQIENLEEEIKSIVDETTKMKDKLQSEADQPYKLFITTVSYKQNPFLVREQLRRIKEMNTARSYTFENDCQLRAAGEKL